MKKLLSLDPHWIVDGTRRGVALSLECPCGCDQRIAVGLANPLDGGPKVQMTVDKEGKPTWWQREGEDFASMTLTPSIVIWRKEPGASELTQHWHGFITKGEVK